VGFLQHLIHGFPLSGPESGHTERRAARNAAVATVLFHPDFNRRLRNHTESADPSPHVRKALAGLGLSTLTAGGDFHPALRTSAARYERPEGNYGEWPGRQQAPSSWGICMSLCPQSESGPTKLTIKATIRLAGLGVRESDSGLFSKLTILARDQLWTSAALAVDGLPVWLRRFRKSHHLIPAGPGGAIRGLQSAATHQANLCGPAACVSNHRI